ncbi:MAG: hypothetical protein ACR2PR_05685 [Pseudohongiellaceae bacterium]
MKTFNHILRLGFSTVLVTVLGSYLYSAAADGEEFADISKVNGGIEVEAGRQVGDVSTVNGGIALGDGAIADSVDTVNGSINLGDKVQTRHVETVNGGIRVGTDAQIQGGLDSVNGAIRVKAGTIVDDYVHTVNGDIELDTVEVGGKLLTVNGDINLVSTTIGGDLQTSSGNITLTDNTTVSGDIIIKGRRSWFERVLHINWHGTPTLTIDANSVVHGDIQLHRQAELDIHEDAEVGEVVEHY